MDIKDIINCIYELPESSLGLFASSVSEVEYPKGFHLFREGRKGTKVYFIRQGIMRAYSYLGDKEVTFYFGMEGDIMFPLQTLFAGTGDYASVELLEYCSLYEMELPTLQELYRTDIHIANWGRKYAEQACITIEKQYIARQFKTSAERYAELLSAFPGITQRVPLGIIASYLGISQVNLSRIRAKGNRLF